MLTFRPETKFSVISPLTIRPANLVKPSCQMTILALFIGVVLTGPPAHSQPVIDLLQYISTFSGEPTGKPDTDLNLLQDSVNNRIANACIHPASLRQLEKLNLPDLKPRLLVMTRGNVLVQRDGTYTLSFPVIAGHVRAALERTVHEEAAHLAPSVALMLDQVRTAVPGDEGISFHLLWSRVMDRIWYRTWQMENRPGKGPPFVQWVLYPESRFHFGTVSYDGVLGGGSNAISWDRESICGAFYPGRYQEELLRAEWGGAASGTVVEVLQPLGLLNPDGRFTGFAYHADGPLDELLTKLTNRYAELVTNAYDYEALSKRWGIPVDELWLVMLHETAYAIFGDLVQSGKLTIPAPLRGVGDESACRQTISFRLVHPPPASKP